MGGLTKKCAEQSQQRARAQRLLRLEIGGNGWMSVPDAVPSAGCAGSSTQSGERRAAAQNHNRGGLIDRGIRLIEGGLRQVHAGRGQSQCQQNQFPYQYCPAKTPHFRSRTPLEGTLPGHLAAVNRAFGGGWVQVSQRPGAWGATGVSNLQICSCTVTNRSAISV